MKVTIVGCGLSGITAARILTNQGHKITIFEKRNHIGGNCYDSNVAGTLVHNYGPHFFHTNDDKVFQFLSQYTEWFPFKYKPKGNTKLGLISLPYSKKTIKELGRKLTKIEIIDTIFKDYSTKQWGVSFEQIPLSIINRIPKTTNCEDPSWFEDETYQCLPKNGYTKMMENMLDGISVGINCKDWEWKKYTADLIIYTGRIDEFYSYKFGTLPYRSLEFTHRFTSNKLSTAVINQNMIEVPYTRKYDHSYFNYQHKGYTIITEEYSTECKENNIPFYPIPFGDGQKRYAQYKKLANNEQSTIFLGRLATYRYLDMWMAVKQSMLKVC